MQFKSFMEALKGNQHKIDKNKNGKIDAHDFKLLQKEDSEIEEKYTLAQGKPPRDSGRFTPHDQRRVDTTSTGGRIHAGTVYTGKEKPVVKPTVPAAPPTKKPSVLDRVRSTMKPVREETAGDSYEEAQKHKALADNHAEEHGKDSSHYHHAMANHHEVMGRWHESKGRTSLAHKEFNKADSHHEQGVDAAALKESEERMARADFKVGDSGRKSHKEIVFNNAESKDNKKEMKEAKMSDADMAERERIVKGMKKDISGFKARYGDRAKEVMYATATKQAMKEEAEELDEKSDQAKRNKTMKNMMDASRGARFKLNNPQSMTPKPDTGHKTPRDHNVAIGRALRTEEEVESVDEKVMAFHSTGPGAKMQRFHKDSPAPGAQAHRDATAAAVKGLRAAGKIKSKELSQGGTDDIKTAKGGTVWAKNVKEDTDYIEEASKENPPFDGPYTKTPGTTKDKSGAVHTPMSKVRHLARMAMKKQMKEQFELEITDEQADTILDAINEQAPVAPVPGMKFKNHAVMVHPETKSRVVINRKNVDNYTSDGYKEVRPGQKLKEDDDVKFSYTELMMINEIKLADLPVRRVKGHSYGADYSDPEGADDYDDKKPMKPAAEKRGRGRPAGAQSGARKNFGSSKLHTK